MSFPLFLPSLLMYLCSRKKEMFVEKKERMEWVDSMRGFTMILVVYSHLIFFGMGEGYSSFLNNWFLKFRMPLFFFVSGFVAFKACWTTDMVKNTFMKKVRGQFLPTIPFFVMWVLFNGASLADCVMQNEKFGYWFTFVMFEVFGIFLSLQLVLKKVWNGRRRILLWAGVAGLSMVLMAALKLFPIKIAGFFSLYLVFMYLPFFLLGYAARMHFDFFMKIMESRVAMCCVAAIGIGLAFVNLGYAEYLLKPVLIVMVMWLFYHFRGFWCSRTAAGRFFSWIGKSTLEIYFIHYFLIFSIPGVRALVDGIAARGGAGMTVASVAVEAVVLLPMCVAIAVACVLIRKVIDRVPVLSVILFGPKKTKTALK